MGGTINDDDHVWADLCKKRYGGIYVPPHQAVYQFAREMLAAGGKMILGSDSTRDTERFRYQAVGEGSPELVKQLLRHIRYRYAGRSRRLPDGYTRARASSQSRDIALAIIGEVFERGYVKNKVMEFVGPGVSNMSVDYRIGVTS